jgi:hypothetical protein
MEQVAPHVPQAGDAEEVDAVVVTDARPLPAQRTTAQVVRTQAAVAAGSFAVGAATAVVVAHRRARRATAKAGRRRGRSSLDVAATRSFLVDVHLLNRKP